MLLETHVIQWAVLNRNSNRGLTALTIFIIFDLRQFYVSTKQRKYPDSVKLCICTKITRDVNFSPNTD